MSNKAGSDLSRNLMGDETSPYLLQHRDNPVHWQPWSGEALATARELGRPVLLSIGYSACHWCHVMAHESFEDETTARLMNELYVNIKLDREERPDLDRLYQTSHQLLSGQGGGWPLTVFVDPHTRQAFFTGTYFPPQPRHGLPAFRDLLARVAEWYGHSPDERARQGEALGQALRRVSKVTPHDGDLAPEPILGGIRSLQQRLDHQHGGFGGAPKFPQGPALAFLSNIANHAVEGRAEAAEMLDFTLEKLATSGLLDHLEGGFYRYCVDHDWSIPHFEKMLYDNAQLLAIYSDRLEQTGPVCRTALEGLIDWLEQAMRAQDGGYYTAIDADSEGEEGRYYVWDRGQVEESLDQHSWPLFAARFGLNLPANFEGHAWHLRIQQPIQALAETFDLAAAEVEQRLEQARETLLRQRQQRVPPETDDKRLTAWNALLASSLVRAARALGRPELEQRAGDLLDFLQQQCLVNGQLYAAWKQDRARFPAYLDDHAALCTAALDLAMGQLPANRRRGWLQLAMDLAETMLSRFQAPNGGFYFTDGAESDDAGPERLLQWQDDATPNGNAMAASVLLRLGHLLGSTEYLDAAESCLRAAWEDTSRVPAAHLGMASALLVWLDPPTLVVVTGADDLVAPWREVTPADCQLMALGEDAGQWPGNLANYQSEAGTGAVTAWVCRGLQCLPRVSDLDEYQRLITRRAD